MNERQILGRAVSFYGSEIQRVVAIEELSELQKELCKSLRSGPTDRTLPKKLQTYRSCWSR